MINEKMRLVEEVFEYNGKKRVTYSIQVRMMGIIPFTWQYYTLEKDLTYKEAVFLIDALKHSKRTKKVVEEFD